MKEHGELFIDHRASPGIGPEEAEHFKKLGFNVPIVPEGTNLTLPTMRCIHCSVHVIKNPLRTRERGRCNKCDDYLCDPCAALGDCRPIQALADAVVGSDKPLSQFSPLLLRS